MRRKPIAVVFTVTGRGAFPFDMLRYDGCHPRHEREVWVLGVCYADREAYHKDRSITLTAPGREGPSTARWESFGWKVTNVDVEYSLST